MSKSHKKGLPKKNRGNQVKKNKVIKNNEILLKKLS
jgi:hypothetical protein